MGVVKKSRVGAVHSFALHIALEYDGLQFNNVVVPLLAHHVPEHSEAAPLRSSQPISACHLHAGNRLDVAQAAVAERGVECVQRRRSFAGPAESICIYALGAASKGCTGSCASAGLGVFMTARS